MTDLPDPAADETPVSNTGAIVGLVLAGGLSRRMGGNDKGGQLLAGRPMIAHVIERLRPQVGRLLLNADRGHYDAIDLPRVEDPVEGKPGPLVGLLAGLRWAAMANPPARWVATVPVDAPFFPLDLVKRLSSARATDEAEIAFATTPAGPQPVFILADIGLADRLERDLKAGTASRVGDWLRRQRSVEVRFDDEAAFANINRPEDLAAAEARFMAGR